MPEESFFTSDAWLKNAKWAQDLADKARAGKISPRPYHCHKHGDSWDVEDRINDLVARFYRWPDVEAFLEANQQVANKSATEMEEDILNGIYVIARTHNLKAIHTIAKHFIDKYPQSDGMS